jgi:hypothetical protein
MWTSARDCLRAAKASGYQARLASPPPCCLPDVSHVALRSGLPAGGQGLERPDVPASPAAALCAAPCAVQDSVGPSLQRLCLLARTVARMRGCKQDPASAEPSCRLRVHRQDALSKQRHLVPLCLVPLMLRDAGAAFATGQVVVTHLRADAIDVREVDWTRPTAIVLGNEKAGEQYSLLIHQKRDCF